MKRFIKGPKMRDVVGEVQQKLDGGESWVITIAWWNTGRAMGLNPFQIWKNSRTPAVEDIKIPKESFNSWLQADTIEELI